MKPHDNSQHVGYCAQKLAKLAIQITWAVGDGQMNVMFCLVDI